MQSAAIRPRARWALTCALALGLAGLARADLTDDLEARLRRAGRTSFTVQVVDLGSGGVLFAHEARRPLVPASNAKLATTAAALTLLGPDYAHETRVVVEARPADGVVRGDLFVVGGGDPTISRRFDPEPLLSDWAARVRRSGITRIEGDVVADARFFDDVRVHPSWEASDLERWYGAEVSGLSLNDNCLDVSVAGSPSGVVVTLRPDTAYVDLDVRADLIPGRRGHRFALLRTGPGKRTIRVTGRVWREAGAYESSVPVADPALLFATVLRDRLEQAGVAVTGRARKAGSDERVEGLTVYARKAPLPRTLEVTNQRSQNFYAECLLKTLGAERGGAGDWPTGAAVVASYVRSCGAPKAEVRVADGSGLSRDGALSARALVGVLRAMAAGPHAALFRRSLAAPGEDGTLRRRLRDLPDGAALRAKTGTLTGVAALSGYLTVGERRVAFAIVGNGGGTGAIRSAIDDVVRAVADHLR